MKAEPAGRPSSAAAVAHYYWVGLLLVSTALGLLAVLACWLRRCRHGGRYEYTALEADAGSQERLLQERKARERAHGACLHYLRACPRYSLVHHLNDIGSRVDKHWFVVRDASVKTERLLTLVPRAAACPLACSPATRATILELFLALQHPYIYPVLDLDFREATGQSYVILVLPFNSKGSLKDLIYKSRWQDDWSQKYGQRSEGLPVWQVQRLGRQILEALLFLKERGFPPCGHLHSGNVILQNGVARLTGLENTLLGHTSRVHPIVWGLARADPAAVDVVCFGHVLFEMCAGYELCASRPSAGQLADLAGYPAVQQILDLIFQPADGRFPGLQELLVLDFFRNIDLREMRAAPLPQAFRTRMTTSTLNLLSEIRRHQSGRRTRRCHSASTSEEPSPPPRERRNSAGADPWDAAEADAEAEAAAGGAGADADDEDDDPVVERQSSPAQEHRDLSLHRHSESPLPLETRCLLRHTRTRAARDSEDLKCD
ncbi:hypothetical protein R5R35_001119 [Gryllus longicercus]|uniref:Slowpoke binding protein n=1 Tax=Gryllus longicercus TaxID=2509291 RepID=A0AAN9Z971_9ORTH